MSTIESIQMEITTLNRPRKVWVYLPEGYDPKGKPYPVIYMHDGQNLFYDELTAYGTAWHVDMVLDDIYSKTGNACIVVGIECDGDRRLSEYSPWPINFFAFKSKRSIAKERCNRGGEGAQYSEFLVNTLKPFIDSHYNTNKDRIATAVAGSSMGGLISCYLGLRYQHVFETMGLFSTYTEFNQSAFDRFVAKTPQTLSQHALVYCGGKEGDEFTTNGRMLKNSLNLYKILSRRNLSCELVYNSDFYHYESAWEVYFYKFAQDFLDRFYSQKQQ